MRKNFFPHLLGMDFETWMVVDSIEGKKLSDKERIILDQGYTLRTLDYTLKTLKKFKQKITFFVVFRLEDLYPGLIERILKEGHEVGWHTYSHAAIINKKILVEELEKSKKYLKKYNIKGFQAPKIIFFKEGYSILKKYGFKYSSSIYGNSQEIYEFDGIQEIPISTTGNKLLSQDSIKFPSSMTLPNILNTGFPIGSSFFWGLLGENYYNNKLLDSTKNKKKVNLFIHNWQVSPYKSTQRVNLFKNLGYLPYLINVSKTFESLLKKNRFQTFEEYLQKK